MAPGNSFLWLVDERERDSDLWQTVQDQIDLAHFAMQDQIFSLDLAHLILFILELFTERKIVGSI